MKHKLLFSKHPTETQLEYAHLSPATPLASPLTNLSIRWFRSIGVVVKGKDSYGNVSGAMTDGSSFHADVIRMIGAGL